MSPTWDTLCKAFIMCNLVDIDTLNALLLLLPCEDSLVETVKDLVRYLASYRHTKAEYTETFARILHEGSCQVRSHVVIQSLKARDALKESRRHQAIVSGAAFVKPSLTQMLEDKVLTEGSNHPQDSFRFFCQASKMASNANMRVKGVAYYLVGALLFFFSTIVSELRAGDRRAFQIIPRRRSSSCGPWAGTRSSSTASRA